MLEKVLTKSKGRRLEIQSDKTNTDQLLKKWIYKSPKGNISTHFFRNISQTLTKHNSSDNIKSVCFSDSGNTDIFTKKQNLVRNNSSKSVESVVFGGSNSRNIKTLPAKKQTSTRYNSSDNIKGIFRS